MRRLEHVGIAVDDLDGALKVFREVLGRDPYKSEEVGSEGVRTHFLNAGSAKLELLEATASDSPIARFLERNRPGLHHLAFEVNDPEADARRLEGLGYRVLGRVRPGADGKHIVFLHPSDTAGVLVELCAQRKYPEGATRPEPGGVFVSPSPESDPLAHALGRRLPVVRGTGNGPAVAVDPEDLSFAAGGFPVVIVARSGRPRIDLLPPRLLVIRLDGGADGPGDIVLPPHLWSALPDPWALVADLITAHLED